MPVQKLGAKWGLEQGSWLETVYDTVMGAATGLGHFDVVIQEQIIQPFQKFTGQAIETNELPAPIPEGEPAELKVVVVGFGRTGTYSVSMALDELGFRTLHTQHWYQHPEFIDTWVNNIWKPSVQQGHVIWGEPDFEQLARLGYTATTDLPAALYFREILEQFPHCKFILTTRPDTDKWLQSWETMTNGITPTAYFGSLVASAPYKMFCYMRWMYSVVNQDDRFLTQSWPLPKQNLTAVLDSYQRHNAAVRGHIPEGQLLEFTVGQERSWETLCEFLNVENCPVDTPFPRTNSALAIQAQTVTTYVLIWFCIIVSVAAMVVGLVASMRWLLRQVGTSPSPQRKTKTS